MFLFGLIVGAALGYLFKPQLDKLIVYIKSIIKDNRGKGK